MHPVFVRTCTSSTVSLSATTSVEAEYWYIGNNVRKQRTEYRALSTSQHFRGRHHLIVSRATSVQLSLPEIRSKDHYRFINIHYVTGTIYKYFFSGDIPVAISARVRYILKTFRSAFERVRVILKYNLDVCRSYTTNKIHTRSDNLHHDKRRTVFENQIYIYI